MPVISSKIYLNKTCFTGCCPIADRFKRSAAAMAKNNFFIFGDFLCAIVF